ncbi:MAG: ABC transporter permease [Verrucomicrobiota bacterium]|nr:ABC transporter permease [Verrucomicrobiota bacterium]
MILLDIKTGWRSLWKTPWLTLAAIITLAVGIGANTAVFSLVKQLMFTSPPGRDLDRVFVIGLRQPQDDWFGYIEKKDIYTAMERLTSFEQMGGVTDVVITVSGGPEIVRIFATRAGPGFLDTYGITPYRGRLFEEADFKGGAPAIMISYEFWKDFFKGDETVLGKTYGINGITHTLVGILPKGFKILDLNSGIVVASTLREEKYDGSYMPWWPIIGRLKPGVTREQAFAEYEVVYKQLYPPKNDPQDNLRPAFLGMNEQREGWIIRQIWMIDAVAVFILLICVFNVANLQLAKARGKSREFSLRSALGASPRQLVRQTLIEHALLGILGGIAGVAVGMSTMKLIIRHFAGAQWGLLSSLRGELSLDLGILAFATLSTLVVILVIALVPAGLALKTNLSEVLNEGGRGATESRGFRRFRGALAGLQIALTTALVIVGGLFLTSLSRVTNYDYGVVTKDVVQVKFDLPYYKYKSADDPKLLVDIDAMRSALAAIPGMDKVAFGGEPPTFSWGTRFRTARMPANLPMVSWPYTARLVVGPDYLEVFQLPILLGETLSPVHNLPNTAPVCLISKSIADRFFSKQSPLGEYIECPEWGGQPGDRYRIIGVMGNINRFWDSSPYSIVIPQVLTTEKFTGSLYMTMHSNPATYFTKIARTLRELQPECVIHHVKPVDDFLQESNNSFNFLVYAQVFFACIGLFLACLGIFGVMSYSVSQRLREMGVRLALGGTPGSIIWMVMRDALLLTIPGVAFGLVSVLYFGHFIENQLDMVSPYEWPIYLVAAVIISSAAMLASWLPARVASRVNPSTLLRDQIR